ncbi:hypothetical protein K1T71_011105 [Dendrolimus kikuchii]|uniref:Uncharacterized protein n=1 Tax=Dendrolimus kikuchii TaxID=765133 RepID=A0ACC1CNE3_9NEOP|nr:hypothetical protein K1T71_011105 [Dendrolimus kikuchii]
MEINQTLLEQLKTSGVGRLKMDDSRFKNDYPPPRLGVYDLDDENLCHDLIKSTCNIPGCNFTSESLLEFENHYNASHRYTCGQCKKVLPSPHLLDLHIQEKHDSFFAVMAERKPSYCCYIEECKQKFQTPEERWEHCVRDHKLPKDFKFEQKPKARKKNKDKPHKTKKTERTQKTNEKTEFENLDSMEMDSSEKKFAFNNCKQKTFKYTGHKFTKNESCSKNVNIDVIMTELKENLPE